MSEATYHFEDVFPDYTALEGQALPGELHIGDQGLLLDAEENMIAFRGLRGEYDPDMLFNGKRPATHSAFYGPGLYATNTDAAMNTMGIKGDRIVMSIPNTASVLDARTFRNAQNQSVGLAAATVAVKWLSMPPPVTHGTFRRNIENHDAMLVAPSLAYRAMSPFTRQPLPDGGHLPASWVVLRDHSQATVLGKRVY